MVFVSSRARARLAVFSGAAALVAASACLWSAPAAHASGGVQVFVGYADNLRANPANFPTPWEGSPGVTYEGCSPSTACGFDGGAVRVVNNTGSPVEVDSVILRFSAGCTYDIWPHGVALSTRSQLIVTQTASGGDNGCTPATVTWTVRTSGPAVPPGRGTAPSPG